MVLAVNADRLLDLDTTDEERAAYIDKNGLRFEFAHLNKAMYEGYGNISNYPTLFLVDSQGTIRNHFIGVEKIESLPPAIQQILGTE